MVTQTADTLESNIINLSDTTEGGMTIETLQDSSAVVIEEGFVGVPRQQSNGNNGVLLIFLIFSFFVIFVAISRKKISLRTILSNKEESKEEVRHTIIDLITTLSLCAITIISFAISIIFLTSQVTTQPILTFNHILIIGGGLALFVLLQQTILFIIGKLFFDKAEIKQFLKENILFYTLPAIILTPTITSYILSVESGKILIYIALMLIFLIRLTFIIRNIKIFKQNISTTCYIILYLCTVEILPLALLYKWALNS